MPPGHLNKCLNLGQSVIISTIENVRSARKKPPVPETDRFDIPLKPPEAYPRQDRPAHSLVHKRKDRLHIIDDQLRSRRTQTLFVHPRCKLSHISGVTLTGNKGQLVQGTPIMCLPELITGFEAGLWAVPVGSVTVHRKKRIVFTLTCGAEIENRREKEQPCRITGSGRAAPCVIRAFRSSRGRGSALVRRWTCRARMPASAQAFPRYPRAVRPSRRAPCRGSSSRCAFPDGRTSARSLQSPLPQPP